MVVDASDNFPTRYAVNRVCTALKKPLVSGAVVRFDGQVAVFDLRHASSPCYHCLFPANGEDQDMRCAVMGVFAPLVGIIGCVQAAETLKILLEYRSNPEWPFAVARWPVNGMAFSQTE